MNTIKAIETVYNGYRFRSRLEARWAVFFDSLGVNYEYEKEGYDFGNLGFYLPDFFLPHFFSFPVPMWVEIKGQPPNEREMQCAHMLAEQSKGIVLLAFLPPWERIDTENDGNWLYGVNTPMLRNVAFSTCSMCKGISVAPYGSIDHCICGCRILAATIAEKLTLDELGIWLSPQAQIFVRKHKVTPTDEITYEASASCVRAGILAKQARFEHGETPVIAKSERIRDSTPKLAGRPPAPHETPRGRAAMNIFGVEKFEDQ